MSNAHCTTDKNPDYAYVRHGQYTTGCKPIPPTLGSSASTHTTVVTFDSKLSPIIEGV